MLSNEKYIGKVHLFKGNEYEDSNLREGNHPPIIRKHVFDKVQDEKIRRSNVVRIGEEDVRKNSRYSSNRSGEQ